MSIRASAPFVYLRKPGPDAVPHALVLGFDEPVAAVLELLDARREQPPLRGRIGPEVGRAVGQSMWLSPEMSLSSWHGALLSTARPDAE